jgi:extradiol dioxygenase family protein
VSKSLLRTVLGPYLLTPKGTGFVFLVKDWMALSRQLADYQEQWRARASTTTAQRGRL